MKGVHGLIIAVVLGLLGAVLNFVYIQDKTSDSDTVMFLGIKPDVQIPRGQRLKASDFEEVPIPSRHAKKLRDFAFTADAIDSLEGMQSRRAFEGGELILRTDMLTPPTQLHVDPATSEGVVFIPVTRNQFEPTLVHPGDLIKFVFSGAGRIGEGDGSDGADIIGPFKVESVGARIGRSSPGRPSGPTIGIRWTMEGDQFDAQSEKLHTRIVKLQDTNFLIMLAGTSRDTLAP